MYIKSQGWTSGPGEKGSRRSGDCPEETVSQGGRLILGAP